MSETEEIRIERHGSVAEVVLCRPEKRNAMSVRFFHEIRRAFEEIDADPALRAAILRAEGPVFSAGLDLKEAAEGILTTSPEKASSSPASSNRALYESIRDLQDCFTAVERCRKPVIAAIRGRCIGGGVDLVTACDIRICSSDASFSIYETRVAIVADVGTLQRITPIVGRGMAREMAYTGRFVPAERALAFGLVTEVHPDAESLLAAAREMAEEIAANSPMAVQGTKRVLAYSEAHGLEEGLEHVAQWNTSFLRSADLAEALRAFAEKRAPKYTGES